MKTIGKLRENNKKIKGNIIYGRSEIGKRNARGG